MRVGASTKISAISLAGTSQQTPPAVLLYLRCLMHLRLMEATTPGRSRSKHQRRRSFLCQTTARPLGCRLPNFVCRSRQFPRSGAFPSRWSQRYLRLALIGYLSCNEPFREFRVVKGTIPLANQAMAIFNCGSGGSRRLLPNLSFKADSYAAAQFQRQAAIRGLS